MTPQQIAVIQKGFAAVAPAADDVAKAFYMRLFELNPELRSLFPEDLTEQRKKLMQSIALVVKSLEKFEEVIPALQEMGKRHVDYDVSIEDYDTVGQALLDTLEAGLGTAFDDEAREAWTEAYTAIATTMQSGVPSGSV